MKDSEADSQSYKASSADCIAWKNDWKDNKSSS